MPHICVWNFYDKDDLSLKIDHEVLFRSESKEVYQAIDKWLLLAEKEKPRIIRLCDSCGGFMVWSFGPSLYDPSENCCKRCGYIHYEDDGIKPIGEVSPDFNLPNPEPAIKIEALKGSLIDFCKMLSVLEDSVAVQFEEHVFFIKEKGAQSQLIRIVELPI